MPVAEFDLVVAGAGIVGLAHAMVARRRGLRVAVVERDHRCVGASIRNFGFVTVTGQRAGDTWRRAMRSRDLWAEVCGPAGIRVEHQGLWLLARRPAAAEVLRAFVDTPMGQACTLHGADEAAARAPWLRTEGATSALYSPHELRVESRDAIPRLAAWLEQAQGVVFHRGESVLGVDGKLVTTSRRTLRAERIVLCPGTELTGVAGAWLVEFNLRLTRLQMLRVRADPAVVPQSAVMADLSLVRYAGYADLPEAAALRRQLEAEEPASLAHGIHLIVVRSADGSLVVGDSHHDDASPEPFASDEVDALILRHLHETLRIDHSHVLERWTGVYPVGHDADALVVAPASNCRVVIVTSGTGASTAFGLAEDVMDEMGVS
jgi:D-hydroxyproline dehydrogenase subunit beta